MTVQDLIKVTDTSFNVVVKEPHKCFDYMCSSKNETQHDDIKNREVYRIDMASGKVLVLVMNANSIFRKFKSGVEVNKFYHDSNMQCLQSVFYVDVYAYPEKMLTALYQKIRDWQYDGNGTLTFILEKRREK